MKTNRSYLALIAVMLMIVCFSAGSPDEPIDWNQCWIAVHCNVNGAPV